RSLRNALMVEIAGSKVRAYCLSLFAPARCGQRARWCSTTSAQSIREALGLPAARLRAVANEGDATFAAVGLEPCPSDLPRIHKIARRFRREANASPRISLRRDYSDVTRSPPGAAEPVLCTLWIHKGANV